MITFAADQLLMSWAAHVFQLDFAVDPYGMHKVQQCNAGPPAGYRRILEQHAFFCCEAGFRLSDFKADA